RSTRASPNSSGASPPTRPRSPTTSAIRSGRSGSRGRETWPRSRIACRGSRTSCARCASSARRSRAPLPVPPERTIVALAGGVGAARFLAGLVRAAPPEHVAVIANTGDDMRFYGVHVSPDVDIVTYTLAGLVDRARGYGLEGDTTAVIDALGALGPETWLRLRGRRVGCCPHRTLPLPHGARTVTVAGEVRRALGVASRILVMSEDPCPTNVLVAGGSRVHFEEYLARDGAPDDVAGVDLSAARRARPGPGVLDAIERAEAILLCPSNPI